MTMPNRRSSVRVAYAAPAKLAGPRGAVRGSIANLSVDGVYFLGREMLAIGSHVDAEFELLGKKLKMSCEVRHHQSQGEPPGMGLRFIRIDPDTLQVLTQYVSTHDPLPET
jgi:c-di-GMP-binding flagellar brake protein YcgR